MANFDGLFSGASGAMFGGLATGVGNYMGAQTQAEAAEYAARQQAQAIRDSQRMALEQQRQGLETAEGIMNPYMETGQEYLGQMRDWNQTGQGADILSQMNQLADQGLNMDYQSDPAYQWRQQQAQEQAQRQMASTGGLDSRLAMDVVGDRAMELSGEEADKQYLRGVDEYNRQLANMTNQYNYGYGNITDLANIGYGAAGDLAGMYAQSGSNAMNQIMNSGMTSASNTAGLTAQAGQARGQAIQGVGSSIGDALGTYSISDAYDSILNSLTEGSQGRPETVTGTGGLGGAMFNPQMNPTQMNPNQATSRYNLGNQYQQLGQYSY